MSRPEQMQGETREVGQVHIDTLTEPRTDPAGLVFPAATRGRLDPAVFSSLESLRSPGRRTGELYEPGWGGEPS